MIVPLPEGTDERAALARARTLRVGLSGLSEHSLASHPSALILGYGRIAQPGIAPGVRELGAAIAWRCQVLGPIADGEPAGWRLA